MSKICNVEDFVRGTKSEEKKNEKERRTRKKKGQEGGFRKD
jgi:hypothetical protein